MPAEPGLYRVRLVAGAEELAHIGQTGRSLRGRLGQLNVAYRPDVPFNDPRTVAPALWALLHRDHCDFEASVTEVPGTTRIVWGLRQWPSRCIELGSPVTAGELRGHSCGVSEVYRGKCSPGRSGAASARRARPGRPPRSGRAACR